MRFANPRSSDPSQTRIAAPTRSGHDTATLVLIGLELFLAVGAIGGAYAMFTQGDAAFDGMVTSDQLPWHSWTIATMSLLIVNAALPTTVAIEAWFHQAWTRAFGHFLVAGALAGWILVQVAILGWISGLQPALLIYAAVIAGFAIRARRNKP